MNNLTPSLHNQSTNKDLFLGEIVESSLATWTAQAWNWKAFPPFGSLVVAHSGSSTIFGIVHSITTGALDGNRTPYIYQKTEAELLAEQPHIFAFLKTHFTCATIGFEKNGAIITQLSPEPPRIHAFVCLATIKHYNHFLHKADFLHVLFSAQLTYPIEEILLAFIAHIITNNIIPAAQLREKLHSHIDTFYSSINNDYRRLSLFVQRIEQLLS